MSERCRGDNVFRAFGHLNCRLQRTTKPTRIGKAVRTGGGAYRLSLPVGHVPEGLQSIQLSTEQLVRLGRLHRQFFRDKCSGNADAAVSHTVIDVDTIRFSQITALINGRRKDNICDRPGHLLR